MYKFIYSDHKPDLGIVIPIQRKIKPRAVDIALIPQNYIKLGGHSGFISDLLQK